MLPLEGVRIISVEQYGAAPFGSQILADLGAEIIKIENPADGGEIGRHVGPHFFGPGDSHFYQSFNRNKKSFTLNLKSDAGREVFLKLVESADGVLDNLRGDLPEKLKITYEHLKAVNSKIICSHLSAYGRTGERASWPGYDYLMQAEAGYLSLTGEPSGPPSRFGLSVVDMMTGLMAIFALVSGIIGARACGKGQDLDTSLFDVALCNTNYLATWYMNEGINQGRVARSGHPSLTPSQLYRTQDGWFFIMCNKEKFWTVLCEEIGKPEWIKDPRFLTFKERLEHRDLLTEMLDEHLMQQTTDYWFEKLQGRVPVAPVYDIKSALENPLVKDTGRIVSIPHPQRGEIEVLACPVSIPGEELPKRAAPTLGEHTDELLGELGYAASQITALRSQGAI